MSPITSRWSSMLSVLLASSVYAAAPLPEDLTELSLDALLDIEVTSVSKQAESIGDAAAAIYVITGVEIERSGARSIPEALRLVPGLHVAQVDGHSWAISSRGFNGTLSDKLEVLIDGRSIYTPLFSGVFWDSQDVFMPDIDRIEVIRGPAATLWGANAVNGVINIVTKTASQTQGTVAYAGGGNEHSAFVGARTGGELGTRGHWRAYGKSSRRDSLERADGAADSSDLEITQVGFRTDWETAGGDRMTVQGDNYLSLTNLPANAANPGQKRDYQRGANLLARWEHVLSDTSGVAVQFYWDHTARTQRPTPGLASGFDEKRDTWDVELRHNFQRNNHSVVWGVGYNRSRDVQISLFDPQIRAVDSSNLFVNDQIAVSDNLTITLSTRFEYNDLSDFDVQPSARFSYRLSNRSMIWGAASQALRLPNRLDHDFTVPGLGDFGNEDFEPEELFSRELGYRGLLTDDVSIDVALFYNSYDKLRGFGPPALNAFTGTTKGAEATAYWRYSETLDIYTSYSYLEMELSPIAGITDNFNSEDIENEAPRNQASIRWNWLPSDRFTVGGMLRHVGRIPGLVSGGVNDSLSDYTELDLRAAWKMTPELEVAVTGQNLLESSHAEWGLRRDASGTTAATAAASSEVERGILAEIIWRPSVD